MAEIDQRSEQHLPQSVKNQRAWTQDGTHYLREALERHLDYYGNELFEPAAEVRKEMARGLLDEALAVLKRRLPPRKTYEQIALTLDGIASEVAQEVASKWWSERIAEAWQKLAERTQRYAACATKSR